MRVLVVSLCTFLILSQSVSAQPHRMVSLGGRVRIDAPACGFYGSAAELEALRNDTLVLRTEKINACALGSVRRIDFYAGRGSHWLLGMGTGFVAGAAVGAVVGGTAGSCTQEWGSLCGTVGAVSGAFIGLIVGVTVGGLIETERWVGVSLSRFQVDIKHQPAGNISLEMSVGF